ncbi:unnamed protein product [Mytilus edulis]|uniref:CARD domain-containing protein n=1 Tax=Mytilus edulis TaxID=6550 RepID=A0A8S3QMJ3_MYTED|nr:unnamed protein product [Mytilus edulis]
MATNQPQNLLEWQLHCVLKRASLLQYYESFIRQGECNVLQLSESDDDKFKDVMEKVGMAKKSIHVRQFKNSLLEWVKDPGTPPNSSHASSFLLKQLSKEGSGKSSVVHNLPLTKRKDTQEQEGLTRKSEKIQVNLKEETTQKQTQSDVKDQKHHDLTGYYDELLDNTVLDKMVLDNLISRCIIMIEDREEIIKPTTQRERNKVLLDILTERPYSTFHLFRDVLQKSEPSNSCVQELVMRMMITESRDEHISWQGHEIGK